MIFEDLGKLNLRLLIKKSLSSNKYETYKNLPRDVIPDTESLKDTYERVLEYFNNEIKDKLKSKNILISAHGNSIRALCKNLFNLDNNQVSNLEIPTGNPLILSSILILR